MNIWIISHYAKVNARQHDLGKFLVKQGHKITILASSYDHFTFKDEHLQPGKIRKEEVHEGVTFVWLRTTIYKKNDWRRAVGMFAFAYRAVREGMRRSEKPDLILGTCVHILAPVAAYFLSRRKKCAYVYEINDMWPQSLFESNFLSNKSIIARTLLWQEKFFMGKAQKVISILPNVGNRLKDIGLSDEKFVWIPNPVNPAYFEKVIPYDGTFREKFVVTSITSFPAREIEYEMVLTAAKQVQDAGETDVLFSFVGDGPTRKSLEEKAVQLDLRNVEFLGWIPIKQLHEPISKASAFLVVAKHRSIFRYGIAFNKLYTSLMGGRPIIFTSSVGNNPVKDAKAGLSIEPENPTALAQAVLALKAMTPEQRKEFGDNGKKYAMENHALESVSKKYERMLQDSVGIFTGKANKTGGQG